ncbi:DUF3039 domain-containing protein [Corynebacterium phocae]|uniref:DUF3039 domain-containing protein n=1 Tax=Corynebacterium phocae TaxID=161895 RepID=UPI0014710EE4|nr:DUF3039 domain-containing protein [Corynebacterium phocae]
MDWILWKREKAARALSKVYLEIQRSVVEMLRSLRKGSLVASEVSAGFLIEDPRNPGQPYIKVRVELEKAVVSGGLDDLSVEIDPVGTPPRDSLFRRIEQQVLVSLQPRQQSWDPFGEGLFYTCVGEEFLDQRIKALDQLVSDEAIENSLPGDFRHYIHKNSVFSNTVNGVASKSMCGVYFVPNQDHEKLQTCPRCMEEYQALPAVPPSNP